MTAQKPPVPDLLADDNTFAIPPGYRQFTVKHFLPATREARPAPQESEVVFIPRKEPDALVLVVRSMTCQKCGEVRSAPENHLFLRTKGHFAATLRDASEFAGMPRETKIIHLPTPECEKCF